MAEQSGLMQALGDGRVVDFDQSAKKVTMHFDVRAEFCHSDGRVVQSGFLTAWMDAAMAQAVGRVSDGRFGAATMDIRVNFLAPAGPGRVTAEGWVERMGRSVAFLEGRLLDEAGNLLATSSSTAMLARRA